MIIQHSQRLPSEESQAPKDTKESSSKYDSVKKVNYYIRRHVLPYIDID